MLEKKGDNLKAKDLPEIITFLNRTKIFDLSYKTIASLSKQKGYKKYFDF